MKCISFRLRHRRGLTLVELLVVVVILVMLVAVTIPLMRAVRSGGEIEAAKRKIESMMNAAKTQAVANGRPAAIVFVRDKEFDPNQPNSSVAYQIALAESPPPYAGDFGGAQAWIVSNVPIPNTQLREVIVEFDNGVRPLRPALDTDESTWFVRPGDTIRFNLRGHKYNIFAVAPKALTIVDFRTVPLQINQLASFQIFRAPRRTAAAPGELPLGSFVVLNAPAPLQGTSYDYSSGISDSTGFQLYQDNPLFFAGDVMISFNSQGAVERLHRGIPSKEQKDQMILAAQDPNLVPRTVKYPFNPVRITVGNGSPGKPEQAFGLLVKSREARPRSVPLSLLGSSQASAPDVTNSAGGGD